MTAHVAPIGRGENKTVSLSLKDGDDWKTVQSGSIDPLSRTAHFRIEDWDGAKDVEYRLSFDWISASGPKTSPCWNGRIRKEPTSKEEVKLAALSCMVDYAFPNQYVAQNVIAQDPDVIFFAGDQLYESVAGYGVVRTPTERSTASRSELSAKILAIRMELPRCFER